MLKHSNRKHRVVFLDKVFAFYRARNRNEKLGFEKQDEIGKSGSKNAIFGTLIVQAIRIVHQRQRWIVAMAHTKFESQVISHNRKVKERDKLT